MLLIHIKILRSKRVGDDSRIESYLEKDENALKRRIRLSTISLIDICDSRCLVLNNLIKMCNGWINVHS